MAKSSGAMIDRIIYGSGIEVDLSSTDHQFAQGMSGLYVGLAGSIVVDMGNGEEGVTFSTVSAGVIFPIFFNKIKKAGTTAETLVALN